jgi:hypothetical protein
VLKEEAMQCHGLLSDVPLDKIAGNKELLACVYANSVLISLQFKETDHFRRFTDDSSPDNKALSLIMTLRDAAIPSETFIRGLEKVDECKSVAWNLRRDWNSKHNT